METDVFK